MSVKIVSDFEDFYDYLSQDDGIVYNRMDCDRNTRAKDLKVLKDKNVNTIEIKAVDKFLGECKNNDKLVVYTDSKAHNGNGKCIMTLRDAVMSYTNMTASLLEEDGFLGIECTVVHVGEKRFKVLSKKEDIHSLEKGKITEIIEIQSGYEYDLKEPIFSIDYLSTTRGLIAIDYNRVVSLKSLRIDEVITAEEVVKELEKAIIKYKK